MIFLGRAFLVLGLAFILPWTYVFRLVREIRNAFWWARSDVMIELESFRKCWREMPDRIEEIE